MHISYQYVMFSPSKKISPYMVYVWQHYYGYLIVLQYRYQVLSEGKRSRVKGSDLALMEPCSDSQSIAVGSRIVGEYCLEYQFCLVNNSCLWLIIFCLIVSQQLFIRWYIKCDGNHGYRCVRSTGGTLCWHCCRDTV